MVGDAALVDHAEAVGAAALAAIDGVQLVDLLEIVEAPHRAVHEGGGEGVDGDHFQTVRIPRVTARLRPTVIFVRHGKGRGITRNGGEHAWPLPHQEHLASAVHNLDHRASLGAPRGRQAGQRLVAGEDLGSYPIVTFQYS